MAQENFCINCGAARRPGSLFCSGCGTKFPATARPVTPAPAAASPPVTRSPAVAAPAPSSAVCKACGNPLRPGEKFCSRCLVTVPDEVAARQPPAPAPAVATPSPFVGVCKACGNPLRFGEKFCSKCLVKIPDAVADQQPPAPAPAAAKTGPRVNGSGKSIPAVECWQVVVTRRAGATKTVLRNPMSTSEITEMVTDSGIQVLPASPSPALLGYPRISDSQIEGKMWPFVVGSVKYPLQSFMQTEQMTVILDAVNKTMYCVYSPETEYVPPIRGVTKFALDISDRMQMMPQSIPKVWSRFYEGDYIANYRHLPVLIGRDYASFFSVVPVTADTPEKKGGLLAFAGDLSRGVKDMQIQRWEGARNPADKIKTLAQVRSALTSLVSSPPATTSIPYKQRVCSACGSVLIFDPDENAIFCPGCSAYTRRYGMSPREARYLDYLVECEKKANQPPDDNLRMMRRAAFCPQCSTWLKYVFIPQTQEHGTPGNHLWYCPHCVSECPEIMDRPLDRPHEVVCSHCGYTDASLRQADVTVCPSCGSQFMTAAWEALPPMPEKDPNETPWEQMNWGPVIHYRLAGQSRFP
jgi:hypothetical protein